MDGGGGEGTLCLHGAASLWRGGRPPGQTPHEGDRGALSTGPAVNERRFQSHFLNARNSNSNKNLNENENVI